MNKQIFITTIVLGALGILTIIAPQAQAIYEDQIEACSFENECVVIDIDDFMNKDKSDLLYSLFNEDIDTYPRDAEPPRD